ncbi:MAG: ATP-grasp domain-containing protein [Burkholderiales bacterium]
MNIFIYEHITGGGMAGFPLPRSLAYEGEAMLRALACDLSRTSGVVLITSRDARLTPLAFPSVLDFERCMREAESVWPIAPETGGALEKISRDTLARGKTLLGSEPETVRICASKLETFSLLDKTGIAAVPTFRAEDSLPLSESGWIVKPDDGAGCLDTQFCHSREDAVRLAQETGRILQPFVQGEACSLSLLCREGKARLLSCNRQRIELNDGALKFLGCEPASFDDTGGVLSNLASRIADTLPGLWGYCGVDFVQIETGPVVVEVNPRLTTSYVGLSAQLGVNVAALVLEYAN